MQEMTFEDPVTSQKFHATDYEVKDNPSGRGRVLRTTAPSGAMAVKIHMAGMDDYGDDMDTSEVREMDEASREVNDTADSMREEEGIASNPTFGISRAVGGLTQGIGGVGPMSWQALRLPAVSFGERKGIVSRIANVLKSLGIDRSTFRRGPYANLITARMWTDYINNMDMQDVGAELSSDISPEERLSVFLFCKEWENDPSHVSFRSRLFNTPDVNSVDEMAKGNIVYDLMTGTIPGPGLPKNMSSVKHDKMLRLASDIIHSMRLMDYNFYTLNTVHRDEGTAVYDEFVSNYVALEPDEVEILHEIRDGLGNHGQSYAFRTTSENGDPLGAFELMNRASTAYETGDTKLARSVLDTLFMHPYNYLPEVGYKGLFDAASTKFLGKTPHHLFINGAFRWILPTADIGNVKDDGRSFNIDQGKQIIEVLSYTHPKPIAVWTKGQGKNWSVMPWEEFSRIGKQAKAFESRSPQESQHLRYAESAALSAGSRDKHGGSGGRHGKKGGRDRSRGGHGGGGRGGGGGKKYTDAEKAAYKKRKKTNPGKKSGTLTLGRGNDFHIYILPKTHLKLKMGKKGRDAAKKHGETKGERLAGITEAFGTYRVTGKHKVTGTNEPYFIRLPQRAFRPTNLEVPAGSGNTIRTLMPYKKTNKKQQKAYIKFLDVYGYPKLANTKGDPVKFVIHKPTRGRYYDSLAKRIKKAKGGKKK